MSATQRAEIKAIQPAEMKRRKMLKIASILVLVTALTLILFLGLKKYNIW